MVVWSSAADSRAIDQFAGGDGNRLSTNPGGVYCDDSDHNDGPSVDFSVGFLLVLHPAAHRLPCFPLPSPRKSLHLSDLSLSNLSHSQQSKSDMPPSDLSHVYDTHHGSRRGSRSYS